MRALTEGALRSLIGAIQGDTLRAKRDRAIIGLMALHGLRRIEVHRLDHESLQSESDAPFLMVSGKRGRLRRIYLRNDTLQAWREYALAKTSAGYPVSGAFFIGHGPRDNGHRLVRQTLNRIVDKYLGEAFLKRAGISCHALRHTMGTLSVAGGAKVEHVQSAMGHESIDTTMIYVKAVERRANNPSNFISPSLYENDK